MWQLVWVGKAHRKQVAARHTQGGKKSMFILFLTQLWAQLLPLILNKMLSQWQSPENKHGVSIRNTVSVILQTVDCFFSYTVIVYYIWYYIKHLMIFSYYHMSPHNISGLQESNMGCIPWVKPPSFIFSFHFCSLFYLHQINFNFCDEKFSLNNCEIWGLTALLLQVQHLLGFNPVIGWVVLSILKHHDFCNVRNYLPSDTESYPTRPDSLQDKQIVYSCHQTQQYI
jgi:hypothetical protein